MIYVGVSALKSDGRGEAIGNGWHDTDDVAEAVARELDRFHRKWDWIGHDAICDRSHSRCSGRHGDRVRDDIRDAAEKYAEASPRRTKTDNAWPMPVRQEA